jgi:hypothetical protein
VSRGAALNCAATAPSPPLSLTQLSAKSGYSPPFSASSGCLALVNATISGDVMQANLKTRADEKIEPTPEEVDLVAVEHICVLLEIAGRDRFSSEGLFRVMDDIERRCRDVNRTPLSKKSRDRMLTAIVQLEQAAIDNLAQYEQRYIAFGFEALANQVVLCAEPSTRTAKRSPDDVKDIHAYARMFRNNIHNVFLSEKISARAIRAHMAGAE